MKKILHKPTKKIYTLLYTKENKFGEWYFTVERVWLYAKDCDKL